MGQKIGRALGKFRLATGDLKRSIDREMTMADMGTDGTPPESTQARSVEKDAPAQAADDEVDETSAD